MTQEPSNKLLHYSKLTIQYLQQFIKAVPSLIREYKAAIIIIVAWVFVSEIAGYSLLNIFQSIIRLFMYPLNWVLFHTKFSVTGVPEVFLLLMPLVLLITGGFIIIISTED